MFKMNVRKKMNFSLSCLLCSTTHKCIKLFAQKKYKLICIFSIITLVIYGFVPTILADDLEESLDFDSTINEQIVETLETSSSQIDLPSINSRSAIVIDRNSNKVLYGKNENEKRKMASTTKIMTSLIIIENCNLQETVIISKKAASTGGSTLGIKTGDKITVKDLLYGLMLKSGNDTAVALAEFAGENLEGFAELMNKKAQELNLKNTHFVTPHGLDAEDHYTTAYELALLTNYALKNETFAQIVGTKTYTVTINGYPKTISNTNELLGNLEGVYGVKTGFTNGANRCLVTACKRGDLDTICIVLGADTKKFRTQDSIKLIEYCFKKYTTFNAKNVINENFEAWGNKHLKDFKVVKGTSQNVNLSISPLENDILPISKDLLASIHVDIFCKTTLDAPMYKGTELGYIVLYSGDEIITKTKILLDCDLQKKNFFDYIIDFFKIF